MNKIILLSLLLSSICFADDSASIETIGGGLTYHLIGTGAEQNYSHKLSPDGRLISNFVFGVGVITENDIMYDSFKLFEGYNSVNQPMYGADYSAGFKLNCWYLGLVGGGYLQNDRTMRKAGVSPFHLIEIGDMGVMPIVGIEANYKISLSDSTYIKINNLVTPLLTNTSLSLGFMGY